MTIEKLIHFIWIGDETLIPLDCINSWRKKNPSFDFKIWGNKDLEDKDWFFKDLISAWMTKEINGAADLMRWEILYKYGGIALDADSKCINPLEDWLFKNDLFAAWENELKSPHLIATGAMGASKKHPFIKSVIDDIVNDKNIFDGMAWQKVGPLRLTNTYRNKGKNCMTIYPSHYFYPNHYTGLNYRGKGLVFADQAWGSTRKNYKNLEFKSDNTPKVITFTIPNIPNPNPFSFISD